MTAIIPDASRADRVVSRKLEDFPLPHGREEEWRFTPFDRFLSLLANPLTVPAEVSSDSQLFTADALDDAELTTAERFGPQDRAAVLAAANGRVHLVDIPVADGSEQTVEVHINAHASGAQANLLIRTAPHSKATVILRHSGSGMLSEAVQIVVGENANLTVVSLQQWADDAIHAGQHDAVIGRDATYRHIAVTLGGHAVRLNNNISYDGPGGSGTMLGVYFADAPQFMEHRSFVDHNAPNCTSLVTYKGALQGEGAHTVWVGDVLIRAQAEGIDTYELNRNLLLTEGARADSVPNLEIETGKIEGAGHASSTGRFDEHQLFYLRSRGIDEHTARAMVVRGFFAEVIDKIGIPPIVDEVMHAIELELQENALAEGEDHV